MSDATAKAASTPGATDQPGSAAPPGAALCVALFGLCTVAAALTEKTGAVSATESVRIPSAAAILVAGAMPALFGIVVAALAARNSGGPITRALADILRIPRGICHIARHAAGGFAVGLLYVIPLLALNNAVEKILAPFGLVQGPQPAMQWLLGGGCTAAQTFAIATAALVLAPIGEETLYRALLLGGLPGAWPERVRTAYAAVFFAALHIRLAILPSLLLLALALGWSWKRFSIVFSAAAHAGFNAGNLALVLLFW